MLPHLNGAILRGNPSSLHAPGAAARGTVEEARASVARLVHAEPGEVLFTASGTEADNLAVMGLAAAQPDKRHVVISAVEHPAVTKVAEHLEAAGYEVTKVGVGPDGIISLSEFAEALRPDTALVAAMWANNEVGVVQPVEELAGICREAGIPFHSTRCRPPGGSPSTSRACRSRRLLSRPTSSTVRRASAPSTCGRASESSRSSSAAARRRA